MTAVRRFLVFQTLLLWQGGFLFYTAVVVTIGTQVLGIGKLDPVDAGRRSTPGPRQQA